MYAQQFRHHPLLVLNNFSKDEPHLKLAATVLQNMFPSINVHKVSLILIPRAVMWRNDWVTSFFSTRERKTRSDFHFKGFGYLFKMSTDLHEIYRV